STRRWLLRNQRYANWRTNCAGLVRRRALARAAAPPHDRAAHRARPRPMCRSRAPASTRLDGARSRRGARAPRHRATRCARPHAARYARAPSRAHPRGPSAATTAAPAPDAAAAACEPHASRKRSNLRSSAASSTLPRAANLLRAGTRLSELEIDLALVDDHVDEPHAQMISELEHASAARADHAKAGAVAREVIGAERAHVNQSIDLQPFHAREQAEIDDARYDDIELFADLILHVLTLEPRQRIARRLIRSAFGKRTLLAELHHLIGGPVERSAVAAAKHMTNTAMDHQVGIPPDGRREMHVLGEREPEMADVRGLIHRLR